MTVTSIQRVLQDALTPTRAAEIAGVDRKTIYNWIQAGRLPSYRDGSGTVIVMRADLAKVAKYARARES